jgi:protein SCO1/2
MNIKPICSLWFVACSLLMFMGTAEALFDDPKPLVTEQSVVTRADDIKLLDLDLVDQDGRVLSFKGDVIKDNLVVINFIYTACKTSCPIQSTIFSHLQKDLGDRLGKGVILISISMDPGVDVPERLKKIAMKYESQEGWFWLTGKKNNVDRVLLGLGGYSADLTEHPSTILIGDSLSGDWTRFYGFPKLKNLVAKVDELISIRNQKPKGK